MGKKHFTEEQIACALRRAESGTSVAEVIRTLGISEQTFFRWKNRFAGVGMAELPKACAAHLPSSAKRRRLWLGGGACLRLRFDEA